MSNTPTPIEAALIILSLITGEGWDEQKLVDTAGTMQEVAFATLLKQGMTREDAAHIVAERVERFKAPIPEPEPAIVGAQRSTPVPPRSEDIAERVRKRLKERKLAGSGDPASSMDIQ